MALSLRHLPRAGDLSIFLFRFTFVKETLDSAGPEPVDPCLDGGLAATEIIRNLLGAGSLHGQFDGEHAFALPTWGFVFEAGKKF